MDVSPIAALLKEAEDAVRPLLGILHQPPDDLTPAIFASIRKIYACQELYHPDLNEFALLNLANHYRERGDYHQALTVAQEAGQTPKLALAAMNLEFALWAEDLQEPAAGVARVHGFLADCPIHPPRRGRLPPPDNALWPPFDKVLAVGAAGGCGQAVPADAAAPGRLCPSFL